MCLTFVYVNPRPRPGAFRLIVTNNRDEYLNRATQPASWDNRQEWLAGRDLTPGKAGGTWLGVHKNGRVGVLTNVYTGTYEQAGAGRGFLVPDFLLTRRTSAGTYLQGVANSPLVYNPFSLLLLDLNSQRHNGQYEASYYCRGKPGHIVQNVGPHAIERNVIGLGNHPLDSPYRKTQYGEQKFSAIVDKYVDHVDLQEDLLRDLQSLMSDRTQHAPDKQMDLQGAAATAGGQASENEPPLTAMFVELPERNYGTRMHTCVLVDHDYNVVFVEKTRQIETCTDMDKWDVRREEFRAEVEQEE